ncbi:MAG: class I tRNA ligase family protein, partial [Muribaculaceae bacterium]|nr:class I tRNA ligase family protein [Muribaculaceae bacterium]
GNAIDPFNNIERFGSDPVRWYMISNSSPWDNLKYDEEGVREVSKKLFATLYNTYKFFALYANVDGFTGSEPQLNSSERPEIDRWILSLLNSLIAEVTKDLDDYEPTKAARAIEEFVNDNLSNWYVRLNRRRFWAGEMNNDKLSAYQTLYTCLKTVALLIAPFAPFYSDKLYSDLVGPAMEKDGYASVHLADFPVEDPELIDKDLEKRMNLAQVVTSNVLGLRRKVNLKVRQPLQTLLIPVIDNTQKEDMEKIREIILDEVNVKEIKLVDNEDSGLVKRVKADFKKLGPKYGKIMKDLGKAITSMSQKEISELEKNGSFTFSSLEGSPVVTLEDVEIIPEDIPGWLVANDGIVTVAIDIT